MINAGVLATRAVGRLFEMFEEEFLGLLFIWIMFAGIVSTEIVIVPGSQNPRSRVELLVFGFGGEALVFGAQCAHVVGIAIDIIAQKDEQIGLVRSRQRQDGLRIGFMATGAESDGRLFRGLAAGKQDQQREKECVSNHNRDGSVFKVQRSALVRSFLFQDHAEP